MRRGHGMGMSLARLFGTLLLATLAFAGGTPSAKAAPNCQASSATLSMPSTIVIQPNTPTGAISGATGTATIIFNCSGLPASTNANDYTAVIQAGQNLATLDSTNNTSGPGITFATNITGLALLVTATPVQATSKACLACGPTSTAGYVPGQVTAPSGQAVGSYSGTVTANYTAQLVKTTTGTIAAGTIPQTELIPFWWYIPGGSVDYISVNLNAGLYLGQTVITVPTCTVAAGSSQTVNLPIVDTGQLSASGKFAGTTPFSIVVSNCPNNVSIATNVLSASGSTTVDNGTGNLKNSTSSANGGAKYVEVQILNGAGSSLSGAINFSQSSASAQNSGTFSITNNAVTLNYYAQYYATRAVTAGAVTASFTYTITYQ